MIDTLQTIAAFIEAIAVAGALVVAIWGFKAWRNEMIGRRRIEIAEELLIALLKARDAIEDIRSPYQQLRSEQISKFAEDHKLDEQEATKAAVYYARLERLSDYKSEFDHLRELVYKCHVSIGDRNEQYFRPFWSARAKIIVAAEEAIEDIVQGRQIDDQTQKRIRATLYRHPDKTDDVSKSIEQAVKGALDELEPLLKV